MRREITITYLVDVDDDAALERFRRQTAKDVDAFIVKVKLDRGHRSPLRGLPTRAKERPRGKASYRQRHRRSKTRRAV